MKDKETFEFYDFIDTDNVERDDGGCALIAAVSYDENGHAPDKGLFVKIQSWDENKDHFDFKRLLNRKVKVTIETID